MRWLKRFVEYSTYFSWKCFGPYQALPPTIKDKNILIINLGFIGDVLATTPLIQELTRQGAKQVGFLVLPSMKELVQNLPKPTQVLSFDSGKELIKKLRGMYDIAYIIYPNSLECMNLIRESGILHTIAYTTTQFKTQGIYKTNFVLPPTKKEHKVLQHLRVARLFDTSVKGTVKDNPLCSPVTSKEISFAKKKFKLPSNYIVISPGSRKIGSSLEGQHTYPISQWTHIASELQKKYNLSIILVGSEKERTLCEEIRATLDSKKTFNLAGKTTLSELSALLKKSTLIVGVDSGPIHIAAAQEAKIVDLISKEFVPIWYPWTDKDKYRLVVSRNTNVSSISAESVLAAVDSLKPFSKTRR